MKLAQHKTKQIINLHMISFYDVKFLIKSELSNIVAFMAGEKSYSIIAYFIILKLYLKKKILLS